MSQQAIAPGPRRLDGIRAALSRFYALPTAEQLVVSIVIRAYVSARLHIPPAVEVQSAARMEALGCLAKAASSLELRRGDAPTAAQYREVWRKLGLSLSATAISDAFDTWALACAAYRGEQVRESSAQRAIQRATRGRRRSHEDYLTGVRHFLTQVPPPLSTRPADYDLFRDEWNTRRPQGSLPLVCANTVCTGLALGWEEVLAVARGELTREEALERRAASRASRGDWGEFLGVTGVATVLDRGRTGIASLLVRPDFPPPVQVREGHRIWRRDDIEAHLRGTYLPTQSDPAGPSLMFSAELADVLGVVRGTVHAYLCSRREAVPPPAGRAGGTYYWDRDAVACWLTRRSERP